MNISKATISAGTASQPEKTAYQPSAHSAHPDPAGAVALNKEIQRISGTASDKAPHPMPNF
jgi:hypothetical protein